MPENIRDCLRLSSISAIILVASILILLIALAFQEIGGFEPCEFCLYQRYPYAIAIVLSTISLFISGRLQDRNNLAVFLVAVCSVAFATGAAMALYHVGVERSWFQGLASCGGIYGDIKTIEELKARLEIEVAVRCDDVPWSLIGISLAGYNFLISVILCLGSGLAVMFHFRQRASDENTKT